MLLRIKTFGSQRNYTKYEKSFPDKIVHLKKIYKLTLKNFLTGHVVIVLIVRIDIENEKFYFEPNLCEVGKKCPEKILFAPKRFANYHLTIFS